MITEIEKIEKIEKIEEIKKRVEGKAWEKRIESMKITSSHSLPGCLAANSVTPYRVYISIYFLYSYIDIYFLYSYIDIYIN